MDEREKSIRARLKNDFPHYAAKCLKIRTKEINGHSSIAPFVLNAAQMLIHGQVEDQLRRLGKVRKIIVKSRQQGSSTYVQGRMIWKATHTKGLRGFIVAHKDDASRNLFDMCKIYYDNLPTLVKPTISKSNAKELVFPGLGTSYKIETAGGRGAGRSETLHFVHLSEVAYYPGTEDTVAGILQAVPNAIGTEVYLESTSSGPSGLFYDMAMAAEGSEWEVIFIPWYLSDEYRLPVPEGFTPTLEEEQLAEVYGLSAEQLVWRRSKIVELRGRHIFRREYPSTLEEAFHSEAPGALWKIQNLEECRVGSAPELARIVVAIDPSGSDRIHADAQGIVAAGLGVDGHGYVLRDATCKLTPEKWARRAIDLYHELQADRIVVEDNFGGQMVESTLRSVDPNVPIRRVHASRGKAVRAEPVAALYEQGRVHHVTGAGLELLADEMVTWDPLRSRKSPNRVDALVWAMTDLMVSGSSGILCREMEI